jgi:hypothetical protein
MELNIGKVICNYIFVINQYLLILKLFVIIYL